MLFIVFKELNDYKKFFVAQLVAFSLFVLYIALIVDTFDITGNLFLLLAIGYNIRYLVQRT